MWNMWPVNFFLIVLFCTSIKFKLNYQHSFWENCHLWCSLYISYSIKQLFFFLSKLCYVEILLEAISKYLQAIIKSTHLKYKWHNQVNVKSKSNRKIIEIIFLLAKYLKAHGLYLDFSSEFWYYEWKIMTMKETSKLRWNIKVKAEYYTLLLKNTSLYQTFILSSNPCVFYVIAAQLKMCPFV